MYTQRTLLLVSNGNYVYTIPVAFTYYAILLPQMKQDAASSNLDDYSWWLCPKTILLHEHGIVYDGSHGL
ncbi:hypothetical protein FPOA_09201 [Fusarium poae]|uniref:Uncharacterized protein n=1 Tax=Fusarium poae TaxID=36050 RepID=A0A1B8AQT3_FUSPO|nr:hypothetical protein FPOA_09201 [Fusarium poae]